MYRQRRSCALTASALELRKRRQVLCEIARFVADHRYPMSPRELEQPLRSNVQRRGGGSPRHPVGPHGVENEKHSRAHGCIGVGERCGDADCELDRVAVHGRRHSVARKRVLALARAARSSRRARSVAVRVRAADSGGPARDGTASVARYSPLTSRRTARRATPCAARATAPGFRPVLPRSSAHLRPLRSRSPCPRRLASARDRAARH